LCTDVDFLVYHFRHCSSSHAFSCFSNPTPATVTYTLSLHDALPICFPPANFPPGSTPSPGSNKAVAKEMLGSFGFGADQWGCLESLWQKESGWNERAMNRYSGAYGIPQSLPGSKMASAGADWQTNPATQIKWGLGYIKGRYGTPCGAWGH